MTMNDDGHGQAREQTAVAFLAVAQGILGGAVCAAVHARRSRPAAEGGKPIPQPAKEAGPRVQ